MSADYSALLGKHGKRPTYTDPDTKKTYTVAALTQAKKAEFEDWLKARAKAMLREMRGFLAADEWHRQLGEYTAACSAGEYAFDGPVAERARATLAGGVAFAAVMLGCPEGEALDLMARRGEDLLIELRLAVAESAPEGAAATPAEGGEGNAEGAAAP